MSQAITKNIPDPVSSRRATAGSAVRRVYTLLVLGLALFLIWLIVKPAIYTASSGQVMAPAYLISTPYSSRVVSVDVSPGDRVSQGDILAQVRSPQIDQLQADLAASVGQQKTQEAEFLIRDSIARAAIPSARQRLDSAKRSLDKLGDGCEQTSIFCASIHREFYEASRTLAELTAGQEQLQLQLAAMMSVREKIEAIDLFVERAFNRGHQISPIDGVVSPRIASAGQSVTAGEVIVEVLDDSKVHIEWVLESQHLRQPKLGERVYVLDGNSLMRGTVVQLLGVSQRAAFQHSLFQRAQIGQVLHIELDDGEAYPPLLAEVEVRYNYWSVLDPAVELYVMMMEALGLWRS